MWGRRPVLQTTLTTVGCQFHLYLPLHHLQSSVSPMDAEVVRNILNSIGDKGHPSSTANVA